MAYSKSIITIVSIFIIVLASAGIVAALDWPHNEGNNIECYSCHTAHNHLGPSLIIYDEINNLCKSYHYEAGSAPHAETHYARKDCIDCHDHVSSHCCSAMDWWPSPIAHYGGMG